ncbi:DNA primase small subunit, partial [Orchesella cincta]
DFLPSYYGRLFPGELMYRWLSYGDPDLFSRREFSFALIGDVYVRYRSFTNNQDFVEELMKRNPEKIDIGAIYNQKPSKRDTLKDFIPLKKEFVLDIDLTDYDDVRSCCQGTKVCDKCWKFIALAVKILDASLRNDFGFEHLLWVFSGRRGVHCWISDDAAINLSSQARAAVLDYLTVIHGGENQAKKVTIPNVSRLHPFIIRSLAMIEEVFEEICNEDQNMLGKGDKNFESLPEKVRTAVQDSEDRFNDVILFLNDKKNENKKMAMQTALVELKLQLCFPRLDVNVSKDLNHLLKSPFCVHPKTGKVCVPFDPKKVSKFDMSQVPNISQLLDEINAFDKSQQSGAGEPTQKSGKTLKDYKKTSLAPYIKIFEDFVKQLENRNNQKAGTV